MQSVELAFLVNIVNDAAVIISQEKRVFSETENIRRAAVDAAELEEPGDEIGGRTRRTDSYNLITPPKALICRSM